MKSVRVFSLVLLLLVACSMLVAQVPQGSQTTSLPGSSRYGIPFPAGIKGTTGLIPGKISYQGLLTTVAGSPATDGSYTLFFEVLDASSSGNLLWSETQSSVTVSHGTFSVLLGSVTPLPPIFNQPLWLQVTATAGPGISSSVVFAPRTELASAPYALGPWTQDTLGAYRLKNVQIGNTLGFGYNGIQLTDTSTTLAYLKTYGSFSTTGYWADKGDSSGRNYFVLRTGGNDIWSIGTMFNNNFSLYSWLLGRNIMSITQNGNVGINNTTPLAGFDVNASIHARDSVAIGSTSIPGNLRVFTNPNFGPGVLISDYATKGAQMLMYDDSNHTSFILQPDFDGQGGYFAVKRSAASTGFVVDGNYNGTLQPFVSILGNKYAAFNMGAFGDNSVQLPDSSISSHEILDGSGIVRASLTGTSVPKDGSVVNVGSATITVPGAGYVLAIASGYGQIYGDTLGNILTGIETASTTSPIIYSVLGSGNERIAIAAYRWSDLHFNKVFPVAAAGSYTYYMNAFRGWHGGTAYIGSPDLTLIYFPKSYGSVTAMVAASEIAPFSSAKLMEAADQTPSRSASAQPVYTVDLRELELRAANARADAERAERELIEARMSAQQQQSPDQQH